MKIQEKIRCLRELKNWSQEDLASKLDMSTNGYSKIERGETKANIPKLEQIAEILEIDLMELLAFGEKSVAFLFGDNNNQNSTQIVSSSTELALEIQKLKLIVEHQQAILNQKDREIVHLEEMLGLLKSQRDSQL